MKKNKKAAMEMSVGTIVTIVLLVSVLVLGLVLISNIFVGANESVSTIDEKIKSEINNIFSSEGARVAIYPSDRKVKLKQGTQSEGFALAINNEYTSEKIFKYKVYLSQEIYEAIKSKCGETTTLREMESWIDVPSDSITVPKSSSSVDSTTKMFFSIPKTAPRCTIPYIVDIRVDDELYYQTRVHVSIV